jgi:hypothetical protein
MICLRRIIERFRAFVGGPQKSAVNRTELAFQLRASLLPLESIRCRALKRITPIPRQQADQKANLPLCEAQCGVSRLFAHIFAILAVRSSKRNGPLVLGHAGGNA